MRENRVLVLPVNILTVWRAGFTWPHDTLPCVLMLCSSYNMGMSDLPEIYAQARGHTAPECNCVYERQITSAHVITNISHCPCRLIAYYGWPKAIQATLNLLYRQP